MPWARCTVVMMTARPQMILRARMEAPLWGSYTRFGAGKVGGVAKAACTGVQDTRTRQNRWSNLATQPSCRRKFRHYENHKTTRPIGDPRDGVLLRRGRWAGQSF